MAAKRAAAAGSSAAAAADEAAPVGAAGTQAAPTEAAPLPGRRARPLGSASPLVALLWLGPALVLIAGVVVYPAIELVQASFTRYSITGLRIGSAGTSNYSNVLQHRDLVTVLTNTIVWVVAVLVLTVLVSLAVAQFLSKDFWGRPIVRWAVIVPWAASLVITARLFTLIYDYYHGILNHVLLSLHVISTPIDFLGDDRWTMFSMVLVGVFVSIPFTAYVFLAGLNAIPHDLYEAARVDGANAWQVYFRITLPLLRPAILVATVLNIIYVFNSFPIVYTLNDRNPGFAHDTSITFMYKLAFKSAEHDVGMAAAAGVANVLLILAVVAVYLRLINWRKETA
jgi:ABC-type sugar transport system permease subunit